MSNELSRRGALICSAHAAALMALSGCTTGITTATSDIAGDFDFLLGRWIVTHRSLLASGAWQDATGECTTESVLGGAANWEDHIIKPASGTYRALGLRSYDSATRQWSIWWLDGRSPHALGAPVVGNFSDGMGTFYGDDQLDGRPISIRFLWTQTTTPSPRWEQAFSFDAGVTWQPNWIMQFRRAA